MIVSAANFAYKDYAVLYLSSFVKNSGVDLRNFLYFVFDFAQDKKSYKVNCYSFINEIVRLNRRIPVAMIPFEDMQQYYGSVGELFKRNRLRYFIKSNLMDYLKALLFKHIRKPFLFLDSDIIVKKVITGLYDYCREKNKIAMSAGREFNLDIYYKYFFNYTHRRLKPYYSQRGHLNTGVLFIPQDYSAQWFDIFSESIASLGGCGHPGQGVWNVLFWLHRGCYLPKRYNCIPLGRRSREEEAVLVHFPTLRLKKLIKYEAF